MTLENHMSPINPTQLTTPFATFTSASGAHEHVQGVAGGHADDTLGIDQLNLNRQHRGHKYSGQNNKQQTSVVQSDTSNFNSASPMQGKAVSAAQQPMQVSMAAAQPTMTIPSTHPVLAGTEYYYEMPAHQFATASVNQVIQVPVTIGGNRHIIKPGDLGITGGHNVILQPVVNYVPDEFIVQNAGVVDGRGRVNVDQAPAIVNLPTQVIEQPTYTATGKDVGYSKDTPVTTLKDVSPANAFNKAAPGTASESSSSSGKAGSLGNKGNTETIPAPTESTEVVDAPSTSPVAAEPAEQTTEVTQTTETEVNTTPAAEETTTETTTTGTNTSNSNSFFNRYA
jgi:hypothetical protein